MTKQLRSIEEVILELGGPRAVAQLTKRGSISTVPMWKIRGSFPMNTYAIMKEALQSRGFRAPGSLWNMPDHNSHPALAPAMAAGSATSPALSDLRVAVAANSKPEAVK